MKHRDQRIYRTFEEFEREELRRADGISSVMEDAIVDMFADDLVLHPRSRILDDDDDNDCG